MKVLILGANGFIGNQLIKKLLAETDWKIYGLDLQADRLTDRLKEKRFYFTQGDFVTMQAWVQEQIKTCDVIIPLIAIANPSIYVTNPLKVFELTFEANLAVVRYCVKYGKRLIFPSTSEVYGLSTETEYHEDTTILAQGPIQKERWIYSCAKQLIDRIIYAYGKQKGLSYTIFRPFNWVGPTQDRLTKLTTEKVRVLPQFISNIYYGTDLKVVDGGKQRRCFTYIEDGIAALLKILQNQNGVVDREIINIGNPNNNISILTLAQKVLMQAAQYEKYRLQVKKLKIQKVTADSYYGAGYQDLNRRVPSIVKAQKLLNWEPKVNMDEIIKRTLDYYLT